MGMEAVEAKKLESGGEKTIYRNTFWDREWTFADYRSASYILLPHIIALFAPFHFTWGAFKFALLCYFVVGCLGLNLLYHRILSHKSLKLVKWIEYPCAYFGMFALQGDPMDWASTHRIHHQFVDTERDPHSPIDGFWFSHMTWTMDTENLNKKINPDYDGMKDKKKVFKLNLNHAKINNVNDLEEQWFYRFLQNTYMFHIIAGGILLYKLGGMPYLTWAGGVAATWGYHVTFMINSVCHIWGNQAYDSRDLSRNNGWVAMVTYGEGWHNNHHAFEYSARHGLEWWQMDITYYIICMLEALGLATDIKLPTEKQKNAKRFIKTEEIKTAAAQA